MEEFLRQNSWVLIFVAIWALPWKGYALWRAARLGQKWWFITLLTVNTLALLEILYIFIFSKRELSVKHKKFNETETG